MALRCTVVSFVPFDIREEKPGLIPPRFFFPASDMKTPTLHHTGTANHFVYLDESRKSLQVRNPADVVAKALVDDYINSQLGIAEDAQPAFYWIEDDLTAEEVLKDKIRVFKALRDQKKWFLNVAMVADNDWNRYQQHNVVSDFQRKCAEHIGWRSEQHRWMSPISTLSNATCPACLQSVPKDIPICPNCKCILDKEKYESLTFAK